jgi:mono/diheme cytochrome c family protein
MTSSTRFIVIGATLLFASAPAPAQDVLNGRHLAERWCSSCHATSTRGSDAARSFAAIAASPAGEPERMRRFLADPHAPMPPMQLAQSEVEDLVAYVASLRPR